MLRWMFDGQRDAQSVGIKQMGWRIVGASTSKGAEVERL